MTTQTLPVTGTEPDETAIGDQSAASADPDRRWCRTAGLQDLGSAQGSGLREARYLMRRSDGQVLQLSTLLYLIVSEVSLDRNAVQVAESVSAAYGRPITPAGLDHVIRTRLQPLGLVDPATGPVRSTILARPAEPVLSLRLRRTLIGERATQWLAGVLSVLFRPVLVLLALVDIAVLDPVVFSRGSLRDALNQVLTTPAFLLALMGLLTAGALVHELGHAAACHYGGARPGVIGVGVYLFFPAFYTNVTDSYRLDRTGRVRTDLGGLYFNVWCLIALDSGYLLTGNGLLLLTALLMHVEMAQQLVPTVRFDGYFVLADLAGVPDLFSRVRPVLLSMLPGRAEDARVTELRPAARRVVTAWVAVVVPLLVVASGWLVWSLPYLATRTGASVRLQARLFTSAWHGHHPAALALAALSILLLLVPVLGLAALLAQLLRRPLRWLRTRAGHALTVGRQRRADRRDELASTAPVDLLAPDGPGTASEVQASAPDVARPAPEVAGAATTAEPFAAQTNVAAELSAEAFTEAALHPPARPAPGSGWRRAVYRGTGGGLNPGLSADERRHAAVLERVTAPITGSRRVVVMSRKGGVGKTTITLALGSMFAMVRGDRVIAVDANPDAGNLAHRVATPSERTITDVLRCMDLITSYSGLREFTSQSTESRLEVLASDNDPRIGLALNRRAYTRVIQLLDLYYNLILLDTGTGILDSANQGLLSEADQLVLVLRPALDGARAAALTLDWLAEHGYGELVARAVVVVNGHRERTGVPLEAITDHFSRRCARVITVPWDRALESGGQTRLADLKPATRSSFLELAASVADHFVTQNPT